MQMQCAAPPLLVLEALRPGCAARTAAQVPQLQRQLTGQQTPCEGNAVPAAIMAQGLRGLRVWGATHYWALVLGVQPIGSRGKLASVELQSTTCLLLVGICYQGIKSNTITHP